MRELLKQYSHVGEGGSASLAELMAPILKISEGVLEDVLEFEHEEIREKRVDGRKERDD